MDGGDFSKRNFFVCTLFFLLASAGKTKSNHEALVGRIQIWSKISLGTKGSKDTAVDRGVEASRPCSYHALTTTATPEDR